MDLVAPGVARPPQEILALELVCLPVSEFRAAAPLGETSTERVKLLSVPAVGDN